MSEVITENSNGNTPMSTVAGVTNIMGYINGLMIGSVPIEFYELLNDVYGADNVNRMIALGGVKYIKAVMNTAKNRADKEERTVKDILEEERNSVVAILNAIFGGNIESVPN